MRLVWIAVFLSSFVLGGCGSTTDEGGNAMEPEPTESDAVEPPVAAGIFAELNGTRLFYESQGEGPSLVLISGANLDSRLWDEQFGDLAERFRVVRYDPRGVGRSDLPQEPFSHYEDLYALLKLLGIESTHVLGFSFGGGVALDFTIAHPEMVESLILSRRSGLEQLEGRSWRQFSRSCHNWRPRREIRKGIIYLSLQAMLDERGILLHVTEPVAGVEPSLGCDPCRTTCPGQGLRVMGLDLKERPRSCGPGPMGSIPAGHPQNSTILH